MLFGCRSCLQGTAQQLSESVEGLCNDVLMLLMLLPDWYTSLPDGRANVVLHGGRVIWRSCRKVPCDVLISVSDKNRHMSQQTLTVLAQNCPGTMTNHQRLPGPTQARNWLELGT